MKDLNNYGAEFQELSHTELTAVTGGESLWYWIGYGIGRSYRYLAADA